VLLLRAQPIDLLPMLLLTALPLPLLPLLLPPLLPLLRLLWHHTRAIT